MVSLFLLIETAAEAKENYFIPSNLYPQVLTMGEHMVSVKTVDLSDKDKAVDKYMPVDMNKHI